MPDAAITTDIIVGFPGETEEDFEQTLDVVRAGPLRQRLHLPVLHPPGHPGRRPWTDQVPKEVVQERYERLVALQEEISWEENKKQVGRTLEVLVAEGEGRKDDATRRLSGRAPDNRLVHFAAGRRGRPRPGDMVTVEVTYAAPHHLLADGPVAACAAPGPGDAWEARQGAPAAAPRRPAGHAHHRPPRAAAGRGRLLSTLIADLVRILYGYRLSPSRSR